MKRKTIRENYGYDGTVCISKNINYVPQAICVEIIASANTTILSIKRARELFEAGLQMCDELSAGERDKL